MQCQPSTLNPGGAARAARTCCTAPSRRFRFRGFGVWSFGFRVSGLSHRRGLGLLERGQLDDLEVVAQLGERVVTRPGHARHAPHLVTIG